jgi:hypothetical protein
MHRALLLLCLSSTACSDAEPAAETDDASAIDDTATFADADVDSSIVDSETIDASTDAAVVDAATDAPAADSRASDAATDSKAPDVAVDAAPAKPPSLGAHTLAFYRYHANDLASITTSAMAAQAMGSTMIVGVGRGDIGAFALPTNNKSSTPFAQLGTTHKYTKWMTSGTATYALGPATLGPGLTISATTAPMDEITLAAIEVRDSSKVQAFEWNEVTSGPLTSKSVTTTGPATLIAFWWGDAFVDYAQTAVPNNGFAVVDSLLEAGSLVQCAVAVKSVATAGTYNVTWTATPVQGAQMWLVAVQ